MSQITELMMRKQNFFLKWRFQLTDLQAEVLSTIIQHEGITQTKICQALNGHDKWFCKFCYQYANRWKRMNKRCFQPLQCRYQFKDVMQQIRWLDEKKVIYRVRSRVTDKWHSRGWDWMQRCFCQIKQTTSQQDLSLFLSWGD